MNADWPANKEPIAKKRNRPLGILDLDNHLIRNAQLASLLIPIKCMLIDMRHICKMQFVIIRQRTSNGHHLIAQKLYCFFIFHPYNPLTTNP